MAYNVLTPYTLVAAGDMSGSITSQAIYTQYQDNIGLQLSWTGAPVGAFAVQISMDHKESLTSPHQVTVDGTWITLTLSPAITASGAPDSAYIDLNQLSAPYVRVVYTPASGTGVLTAFASAKAV